MKIGVIVAMEKEFVQLECLLTDKKTSMRNGKQLVEGVIGNHTAILQQCGIGKVNAALGAAELISGFHPDLVVSTGVAGGVPTYLKRTDVVVGTSYTYHDVYCGKECKAGQILGLPASFAAPEELVNKALSIGGSTTIHAGQMVTGDWFVDSKDKMQQILEVFPEAVAVDMESCAIAHTCHIYRTPFISFRIISDIPLKDEDAAQYFDFWKTMADNSFLVTKSFLEAL